MNSGYNFKIFIHFKKFLKIHSMIIIILLYFSLITGSSYGQNIDDIDGDNIPNDFDSDDDGDGFDDDIELAEGTDPLDPNDHPETMPIDTDGDLIPDSLDTDDDNDGLTDVEEIKFGTDQSIRDTDSDYISDYEEIQIGTNPINSDTDDDTFLDGIEILVKTDPLNKNSYPQHVIADAGSDQIVYPNEAVFFKAYLSIGNIRNYSWDFDNSDGIQNESYIKDPSHVYEKEGIYTVSLTVSDGKKTDMDTCLVRVNSSLALKTDIIKNQKKNYIKFYEQIDLNLQSRTNNSLELSLNGVLAKKSIISFSIDSYTLNTLRNESIRIKFDNMIISEDSFTNVTDSDNRLPVYNLTNNYDNFMIVLSIPQISNNSIQIIKYQQGNNEINPQKSNNEFDLISQWWFLILIIGIIIIILCIIFIYQYQYTKNDIEPFYKNLNIDEYNDTEIFQKIKSKSIDWEEYDSDK